MRRGVDGTTHSRRIETRDATSWFFQQGNPPTPSAHHPGESKPPAAGRGQRSSLPSPRAGARANILPPAEEKFVSAAQEISAAPKRQTPPPAERFARRGG